MLQVRFGTIEYNALKYASRLEGVSVSEFAREAIAKHARLIAAAAGDRESVRALAHSRQVAPDGMDVKDMTDNYELDAFLPGAKGALRIDSEVSQ